MAYTKKPDWGEHMGMIRCPICDDPIFLATNMVALDLPARPIEDCQPIGMQLSHIGAVLFAVYDDTATRGHPMHTHQPPEMD